MTEQTSYRRICNSRCGLNVHIEEHRFGNTEYPSSTSSDGRIGEPMKRIDGVLTPVSWDLAIQEVGAQLRAIRKKQGPSGLGVYIGEPAQRSARSLLRSLAFGVGSGTPNIFSEANLSFAPQLWATEQMLGHAASLMSDLSRAHYIVLLSGEQRQTGWGAFSPGEGHEDWIQHSRKTKKTKVVVADPRRTELAETMDKHLPIRPGSESYLMLGMLTAIVQSGWTDDQFIQDYTNQYEQLQSVVADWSVDDFAAMCGIDTAELNGVALSFSRSAMSLIHPARQSFQNEAGALGAWAWLAIHAVTANILRPGGIFENKGVFDLFPVLTQIRSEKAPKTGHTQYPLMLMQAPASALPQEINQGPLRALITVSGNPIGRLPDPKGTKASIAALDLLVYIGQHHDETAEVADWVLPSTYPWEQTAMTRSSSVEDSPSNMIWSTPHPMNTDHAQPEEKILSQLYSALKPGLRGSVWGRHLGLFAQYVARADLEQWEEKVLSETLDDAQSKWDVIVDETQEWSKSTSGTSSDTVFYLHLGNGDRSLWRPSTATERVQLLSEEISGLIQTFSIAKPPTLVLRTSLWRDESTDGSTNTEAIDVRVHPDMGLDEGAQVQIKTAHGECSATVVLDDRLRADVIDLPFHPGSPSLSLLASDGVDARVGSMIMDGIDAKISTR